MLEDEPKTVAYYTRHTLLSYTPERLKHQTQMLLVIKVAEQTKTVELVIRISIIELL